MDLPSLSAYQAGGNASTVSSRLKSQALSESDLPGLTHKLTERQVIKTGQHSLGRASPPPGHAASPQRSLGVLRNEMYGTQDSGPHSSLSTRIGT